MRHDGSTADQLLIFVIERFLLIEAPIDGAGEIAISFDGGVGLLDPGHVNRGGPDIEGPSGLRVGAGGKQKQQEKARSDHSVVLSDTWPAICNTENGALTSISWVPSTAWRLLGCTDEQGQRLPLAALPIRTFLAPDAMMSNAFTPPMRVTFSDASEDAAVEVRAMRCLSIAFCAGVCHPIGR